MVFIIIHCLRKCCSTLVAKFLEEAEKKKKIDSHFVKTMQQRAPFSKAFKTGESVISLVALRKRVVTLTNQQLTYLKTTPFHWVSKLSKEMKISNVLLRELVKRWNEGGRGFYVRGTMVPFTPVDVCLTLGLPATGHPVVGAEDAQCYTMSMFGRGEVTIEDILNKLAGVEDEGDFSRTYILLAFAEFYFPTTGRSVFTDYAWLLDDLEATNTFNWARAVYDYLINSLRKAVAAMDSGSNEHQIHLCGCAAILQIWAMNHLSIGETPATPPEHPFPRILNWPILALRNKKMKEAFQNARVTVALTATDIELQDPIVRDAFQLGQQHEYVHVNEHEKVLAKLREHEEKHREHEGKIKALEADIRSLKEVASRRRSQTPPVTEYGGCSTSGRHHDASPLHQTPAPDLYADVGGIGGPDVQTGLEMVCYTGMVADARTVEPPTVMACGPEEAHVEGQTGEDTGEGASKRSSNIATRIKGGPRTRTQSVILDSPYVTRAYVRKNKRTTKK